MFLSRRNLLKSLGALTPGLIAPRFSFAQSAPQDGFQHLTAAPEVAPIAAPEAASTDVWAYNGSVPGPILRARQGEEMRLRFNNELPQPSTIHWHGIRIDNRMDGVAYLTQDPVLQGESFDYVFTPPDAGTYWYHPHARTWEQLARGLYGLFIVEEKTPLAFDADIALMVDDWRLDDKGAIDEASFGSMMDWSHAGRLGNWVTVNGVSTPQIKLPAGGRARLRLANSSNARVMELSFKGLDAEIIAIDGQPVPVSEIADAKLTLAPAQRVDVAVRVPRKNGGTGSFFAHAGGEVLKIANFRYIEPELPLKQGSVELPQNPLPTQTDLASAQIVDLVMEGGAMGAMREATYNGLKMNMRELVDAKKVWAFNGIVGRAEAPFFSTQRGRTVVVNMINDTSWPHAMHFHGHHFRVIERDLSPVDDEPWRDTVLLKRGEKAKVAFKADNPGKWMVHCHMLEHQAAGMAAWFEVS